MTARSSNSARRCTNERGAKPPGGHGISAKQLRLLDKPPLDVATTGGTDELTALRRRDLATTINRCADRSWARIDIDPHPFDTHTSDRVRYHDDLWVIWTVAASNVVGNEVYLSEKGARHQLENRFHQHFRTVDNAVRRASHVVASILTQLLVPQTGTGFGLGVAPGAITSQGTRSARDYLDFLISLSGESATELEHRYRLGLSRSDAAVSSWVDENATMPQGFRDTFPVRPRAVLSRPRHDRRAHRRVAEVTAQVPSRELLPHPPPGGDGCGHAGSGRTAQGGFRRRHLASGTRWLRLHRQPEADGCLPRPYRRYRAVHAHYHCREFPHAGDSYTTVLTMALKATESTALGGAERQPLHSQPRNLPVTRMTTFRSLQNIPGKALATGDYATAVSRYRQAGNPVRGGPGRASDQGGYKPISNNFEQYAHSDLPYTVVLDPPSQRAGATFPYPIEAEANGSIMHRTLDRSIPLALDERATTSRPAPVRPSASLGR